MDPGKNGWKYIPRVIIWDKICTVPRHILERFLGWLEHRSVQVICCGDQGQPPPIAGEMPHDWLCRKFDNYKEVEIDYRAKDPVLIELNKRIRLQSDMVQCREMRKAIPNYLEWDKFVEI